MPRIDPPKTTWTLIYANTLLNFPFQCHTSADVMFYIFFPVFRQGDTGKCWYAVLAGSLDVRISQPDADPKVSDIYVQHKCELWPSRDSLMQLWVLCVPGRKFTKRWLSYGSLKGVWSAVEKVLRVRILSCCVWNEKGLSLEKYWLYHWKFTTEKFLKADQVLRFFYMERQILIPHF